MEQLLKLHSRVFWASSQVVPRFFCNNVPHAHSGFSLASLYLFAQALGIFWVFLVSLLAVICVRIVTVAVDLGPGGSSSELFRQRPLQQVALCYVYYAVVRVMGLFARSFWTVAWELYHNFPTLRRMLLGAPKVPNNSPKPSPRDGSERSSAAARPPLSLSVPPKLCGESSAFVKDATAQRRNLRRHVVLVMPLLVLAGLNLSMIAGQIFCDTRREGIFCRELPIFDPTGQLNRSMRFVLFLSVVQWTQAWTGLFPSWHVAMGKAPRSVSATLASGLLLFVLVPASGYRMLTWLVQPAGSGVVLFIGGLLPHWYVDSVLVAAWSLWSLLASFVVMQPQVLRVSGFTLRSVSNEASWRSLCTLFKYTIVFWMGVHLIRGCMAYGFAHAQSDLITICMLYPIVLCLIWTVTFVAVALAGLSMHLWQSVLGFSAVLGVMLLVSSRLCIWVNKGDLPLLVILTWLHLVRAAFRVARRWLRYVQCLTSSGGGLREQTSFPKIKFAVDPNSSPDLRKTYSVERRFGRIAIRLFLLICGSFSIVLTSLVVMAGVQQRRGLFVGDIVWWRSLEDGRSVEIVNAGASVLTLGANISSSVQEFGPSAVLAPEESPDYAVCGQSWQGLQLTDYALISLISYMSPTEQNDLPKLLSLLFPHMEVSVQAILGERQRRWLVLDVKPCKDGDRRIDQSSRSCKPVTVVAVSGTDVTRMTDFAENLRMWTEPVSIQILSTMFPTVRIWPRESTEMVIQAIHNILASLGLQDDQWHYREILDYVRQIPADREVVVTGHSLGGGIALVVGALTGRLAVAVQPPGIYHSLAKHQTQHGSAQSAHALHKRSVSLVFEGDWVQNFDGHGGLVQTMMCDQQERSLAVGCHLIEGAICHLLRHCGDQAQRFATCRHEYQPTSTAVALARSLWGLLRASFLESSYPAYLKGNLESVLYAGLAVSLAAVVRHGAPPMFAAAPRRGAVGVGRAAGGA